MYDLLLKNGHIIDPSSQLSATGDVAFDQQRVAEVGNLADAEAHEVRDVSGCLVTPGLIDLHTHVYWGGTAIGVDPDFVGERSGCTTLVDAGTAGAANFLGFRRHVIEPARTRILAFINISFPGIYAFSKDVMVGECGDLRLLNARECLRVAKEHTDIVAGVKVRVGSVAGGSSGIGPLDVALGVAEELQVPVMAHLDYPPPARKEVVNRLRTGDVLTHCFRPFPNAPVRSTGRIYEEILEARERGVVFDIGHGMGSFGFRTSRAMLENQFWPDTISSDVHSMCIDGPAFNVLDTMSKFLNLGMPVEEVIRCTTQNPARALGKPELGTLQSGAIGDATILELREGDFQFADAVGETISGKHRLVAVGVVVAGKWHSAGAGE